jgi:transcriptional regulator with XRE-family HTH domain
MYMLKVKDESRKLRWRLTCIRHWRELRGFTLERAAEALSRPPYKLKYTHNSLGRVERGEQMPPVGHIEALASLYRTDIESLLNRRPEDHEVAPTASGILQLWDKAESAERVLLIDIAKRVVPNGGTKSQ